MPSRIANRTNAAANNGAHAQAGLKNAHTKEMMETRIAIIWVTVTPFRLRYRVCPSLCGCAGASAFYFLSSYLKILYVAHAIRKIPISPGFGGGPPSSSCRSTPVKNCAVQFTIQPRTTNTQVHTFPMGRLRIKNLVNRGGASAMDQNMTRLTTISNILMAVIRWLSSDA